MRAIDRLLYDDEEVFYLARKHPSTLYRSGLMFVVAAFLGSIAGFGFDPGRANDFVDLLAGGLVALIGLRFLMQLLRWRNEYAVVTQRRLIVTSGLLSRKVTTIPISRIQGVTLERSFAGRLQRSGTVVCDVGDHGVVEIRHIARVKDLYRELGEAMSGGRSPGRASQDRLDTPLSDGDDTGPLPRVVL